MTEWLNKGLIYRAAPRTFAFVERPSWRQQVHAIYLSSPDVLVSHRSAARLWNIAPVGIQQLEFVGPTDVHHRLKGVRLHESNCLPYTHRRILEGTAVTSPARTVIDLSAVWRHELLTKAVHSALDRQLATIAELRRTLDALRRRGRRRTTFIEEVISDPLFDDPKNRSALERQARVLIKRAGLPEPEAQHAIVFEHFTLHPDMCYPQDGLAIELDGYDPHGTRIAFDDDRERDALLAIEGWNVVRFSSKTLHLLVPAITAHLNRANAS